MKTFISSNIVQTKQKIQFSSKHGCRTTLEVCENVELMHFDLFFLENS